MFPYPLAFLLFFSPHQTIPSTRTNTRSSAHTITSYITTTSTSITSSSSRLYSTSSSTDEERLELLVGEGEGGYRLDQFLALHVPGHSRTYCGDLCKQHMVAVNGKEGAKKSLKVQPGDVVEAAFILTKELQLDPENIPLDIIFEDDEILVLNKPPGLVVHPAPGHWSGTLVNGLLYHLNTTTTTTITPNSAPPTAQLRPGIVHRLDKGEDVVIELPIGRHPVDRQKMAIAEPPLGRNAKTLLNTLAFDGRLSVVKVNIETGRTHQIRVHLQNRRTPVAGDDLYGNAQWNAKLKQKYGVVRPLLHASSIQFLHPSSSLPLSFEAPPPPDMARVIRAVYPQVHKQQPRWLIDAPEEYQEEQEEE